MEEKELKIEKLEMKVDELEMKNKSKSIDVIKLDEKISDLENENSKLKDVLYGCCECGLFICECSDAIANDSSCSPPTSQPSPPSVTSYETLAPQHLPSPRSASYSWTPPPTPPCEGCGGINYGPSPSNLCFDCIPPLKCKSQPSSPCSPPRTLPGSPPSKIL